MSQLKNVTIIVNGKPSKESFKNFVKIINEASKNNKLNKAIMNDKNNLREASNQAKQDN